MKDLFSVAKDKILNPSAKDNASNGNAETIIEINDDNDSEE